MLAELEKLNENFETGFGLRLGVGIGLHAGHVGVGNMGSEDLFDYTIIGDSVNLASTGGRPDQGVRSGPVGDRIHPERLSERERPGGSGVSGGRPGAGQGQERTGGHLHGFSGRGGARRGRPNWNGTAGL